MIVLRRGCGLRGSLVYCRQHPGLCCAACGERTQCERACLNDPSQCGYACTLDTATYARPASGQKKGT